VLFEKVKKFKEYKAEKAVPDNFKEAANLKERLAAASDTVRSFNDREQIFGLTKSEYEDIDLIIKEFEPFYKLWECAQEFAIDKSDWNNKPFVELKYEDINKKTENYNKEAIKLQKTFQENKEEDAFNVTKLFQEDNQAFRENIWLIELLTTEAMIKKPGTWKEIFLKCNVQASVETDDITLFKVINDYHLLECQDTIREISDKVGQQWKIEKKLNEIKELLKLQKLDVFYINFLN